MEKNDYTISQVARRLGINTETIRYYERRGLIEQPEKPISGFRLYNEKIINRIHFIKRAQALGFSLKEIESLLALQDRRCEDVQQLAQNKLLMVEDKIRDLEKLHAALNTLVQQCQHNDDDTPCPLIDALRR